MAAAVEEAARFLAARSADRIALSDVAEHVGYSPFHLARSFEARLGIPPGRFLGAHRFQLAKRLLLAGDERVVDVCHAAGFDSLGTFTTRFAAAVGASPGQFRRLPEVLAGARPGPVSVPGPAPGGGAVSGSVSLAQRAGRALGPAPSIYVGLFTRRLAGGPPVAGARMVGGGPFLLAGVPPGSYWLLGAALAVGGDARSQLVPERQVVGGWPGPIQVGGGGTLWGADLRLDLAEDWLTPVVVALPVLGTPLSPTQQDRRSGGPPVGPTVPGEGPAPAASRLPPARTDQSWRDHR
ncbi:MAG: helix-turn-helix transcriptional regulator [Acidimicrobiales bacterium]